MEAYREILALHEPSLWPVRANVPRQPAVRKTATVEPLEVLARSFMLGRNSSELAFMTDSFLPPGAPDFDLSCYQISPCIDFIKFSCPFVDFGLPSSRLKRHFDSSTGNAIFTLHDPRPEEVSTIADKAPNAMLEALEVSLDFFPKKGRSLSLAERDERLEQVRQWLIGQLYPWEAPGIQAASRASQAAKNVEALFNGDVERRPYPRETLYLGHKDAKYAAIDQPNFAFMRVYRKVTDNRQALAPNKRCCRVEVNLNQEGCAHFQLQRPADLLSFNYRKLGSYFRLIRPQTRPVLLRRLRQSEPKMAEVLEKAQTRHLDERLESVGAYAAGFNRSAFITSDRSAKANDRLQQALKSLTRTWR